ncbi:LuxR family two component transcriptional regulator [Leucobacter luti]|uniref:LuxR family two component transcriptional regulator n=1 Tax=Leucobacter luti TaxID=340320 RepID=A0A4R6S796_9MICO|nr:response regulator transcription factor [Leucobacter luti]TDP95712.1 LuxR family two component transcriptional regulator [Leucobacter luti]
MSISVLLVDDHALIRQGNALLIDSTPDLAVAGEAATGEDAVRQARRLLPDVVLMDVRMPGIGGIEATRQIVSGTPDTRVLVLTTFDLDAYAFGSLTAGASGFLTKRATPEELTGAIRLVAAGESVLAPRATRRLIEAFASAPTQRGTSRSPGQASEAPDPLALLSPRELDVFMGIARGLSNAELSAEFTLSLPTIKSHINRILAKLGARDRVQLVILAYTRGLAR